MDERVIRFRVGVVVLATIIVALILVVLFGERKGFLQKTYTLYIHFANAPGVTRDTPVRKSGILIGRVADVRFADQDSRFEQRDGVNVSVAINANYSLRRSEVCRISSTLLGDAVLEFVPGIEKSDVVLGDGDYLEGRVSSNPLEILTDLQGDLGYAVRSVGKAGNEFGALSQRLNDILLNNDDQLSRIVGKTEKALDGFQRAMANADKILGDEELQANLRQALTDLPETLKETRAAINGLKVATATANRNLANLENFTKPLGDNGERIVEKVDSSIGQLDELLGQMVSFSKALNQSEGSLGQLVNNRELYDRLNASAGNIEKLTRELRPIIRDARVFTDKIARDPSTLGVKGALQKKAPIK